MHKFDVQNTVFATTIITSSSFLKQISLSWSELYPIVCFWQEGLASIISITSWRTEWRLTEWEGGWVGGGRSDWLTFLFNLRMQFCWLRLWCSTFKNDNFYQIFFVSLLGWWGGGEASLKLWLLVCRNEVWNFFKIYYTKNQQLIQRERTRKALTARN